MSPDGTHEWMFEGFDDDSTERNLRALGKDRVHAMGRRSYEIMGSHSPSEFADMSDEDMAAMKFLEEFTGGGGLAYNQYQSAQPQTLSYALHDSPAGWLGWICQLFREWVDRDYILVNASAYWLTNTIGSSIRRYYADAHAPDGASEPTTVPTGVAIFAEDFQSVRKFAERDHKNIVRWNRYPRGSHFAPQDAPDLLLDDIRAFFQTVR